MELKKRELKTLPGNWEALVKSQPTETVGDVIDEPTLFLEEGKPVAGYFFIPQSLLRDLRKAVQATKPTKSFRTHKGLATQSTVYGAMPRHTFRNDYCRFTKASYKEKELFSIMNHGCELACEIYEKWFPEHYKAALAEVATQVPADWRHNTTPYLTININMNHAIKYHRDTGNFKGALSTVLILKEGIEGGQLVVPEYGFTLSQRDGAFSLFEGQRILHGVLPIKKTTPTGYRASVVYYSLSGMKNCYPYQEELKRASSEAHRRNSSKYSLENKKEMVKGARRALERINSPWLKLLEEGADFEEIKKGLKK